MSENKTVALAKTFLYDEEKEALMAMYEGYRLILKGVKSLGFPVETDANFEDTAYRCSKAMIQDFIWSKNRIKEEAFKTISTAFPANYDEMVVETGIHVISLCPHHLLPVEMLVNIGYIPGQSVLGISKLARLAKLFGKQPILQEQYCDDLAKFIMENIDAKGVGVSVFGTHGCMAFRGVNEPDVTTITSTMLGGFRENQATRNEFLSLCKRG